MPTRIAAILSVTVVLYASARAGQAADPIGTAYELTGSWLVQQGTDAARRPIVAGRDLPAGAVIHPPREPAGARLVVVYRDGEVVRFECPRDCASTVRLKTTLRESRGAWQARWDAVQRLFWGNPPRYRSTITRSDAAGREAVVRLDAPCIDLSAALTDVAHGPYVVELRPTARPRPASPAATDRSLEWDGTACLHPVPALTPGLYEVEMRSSEPGAQGLPPFWILALAPREHAEAADAYRQVEEVVRDWPADVTPATRRAVLRAFLDQLSRERRR